MSELERAGSILQKTEYGAGEAGYDEKAFMQMRVDGFNSSIGTLNKQDGYDCTICKNKGVVARLVTNERGCRYSQEIFFCKCRPIRASIMRMKMSGLEQLLQKYRFENYVATEAWQKHVKEQAEKFSKGDGIMFFIGGQSGSGKSHLCTAIARELLYAGHEVRYSVWRDESVRLKAVIGDDKQYQSLIDQLKNIDVLYIDDFLKTPIGRDENKPTSADLSLALEIINNRYNAGRITILSSEWNIKDIINFDEALGGRIYEMCNSEYCLNIKKDRSRNYRTRNITEV